MLYPWIRKRARESIEEQITKGVHDWLLQFDQQLTDLWKATASVQTTFGESKIESKQPLPVWSSQAFSEI